MRVCISLLSFFNVFYLAICGWFSSEIQHEVSICSLHNVTVDLTQEFNNSRHFQPSGTVLIFPMFVYARRCAGGCGMSGLENQLYECVPTGITYKRVVQIVQSADGIHRRVLKVRQHTGCACPCRANPTGQCLLAAQQFDPDSCRCVCTNRYARWKCATKRFAWGDMFWDETRCECRCPQFLSSYVKLLEEPPMCSSMFEFNHNLCRCVPKTSD